MTLRQAQDRRANATRGEAKIVVAGETLRLRPSFAALVAAEEELGPLFALVERAAEGELRLGELVTLFWHCLDPKPEGLTRERFGEGVAAQGLANVTPALKTILSQILQGR
ncbi:gene transfer agent family protein [Parasphingopyxis algicola]|uniref:gene transfer agent family protein n=1 Tax=Parasphingopyxis algicola TaxID=2026624 RepID=UPI0015A266B1|nr:gene transfer agent family protein [Parasphingopyxis algicola]QLC23658.1 gene transfer agent family protein [Parasphingopyxis algicola]